MATYRDFLKAVPDSRIKSPYDRTAVDIDPGPGEARSKSGEGAAYLEVPVVVCLTRYHMTDLQWTAAVVAAFLAATFLLWRRAKKDMLGAITLSLLLVLLAAVLLVVSGCTISQARRPWMEAGIAWDREGAVGHNPACIVRVRAPIGPRGREEWIVAGFTHHSSCPDQHDRGEVNQIEITATIPLGRRQ